MLTATATLEKGTVRGEHHSETVEKPFISWEDFKNEYLTREDGFKYEWLAGVVEKTPYTMERTQFFILKNLQDCFNKLKFEGKLEGNLITEGDLFFDENHRRPDICWLTDEQIASLAANNKDVPAFVIEIISTYDMINRVAIKMEDYRIANVQVVWHIFPKLKQVHIYTGQNLMKMKVHKTEDICSAAPVLPDYQITVNEIFTIPDVKGK